MRRKPNFSFKIKFAEFLLVIYLLAGGLFLAFSSGGFVINFKQIGFSVFSSLDKGVHFVVDGVVNTFNAVGELRKLKKDYNDLVIKLEEWSKDQEYDRMGLEENYIEYLGNKVVCYSIPVMVGRNVSMIIESAALNHRQIKMGYNAAEDFRDRMTDRLNKRRQSE